VFDTGTPGNRAQELYYRFLCRVSAGCCRHVVIIAGNHDSPTFLDAPRELLRVLNVHVVGTVTDSPDDQVIVLSDGEDPSALVCAVPYLRDRDIRLVDPGESVDEKNSKLMAGIRQHYAGVVAAAERKRDDLAAPAIPIIAMGHLFTAGGQTVDGDGVRDLYVGSLIHVGPEVFPPAIDYLALGHLHVPQTVGGSAHIRYSGSPIPMGFGEAAQEKSVVIVDIGPESPSPSVRLVPVPCFQPLSRLSGNLEDLLAALDRLKKDGSRAWLEIDYTGLRSAGDVREALDQALSDSDLEIRRIRNRRVMDRVMQTLHDEEMLDDLDVNEVFDRCLHAHGIEGDERTILTDAYGEILRSLDDDDVNAL
jgi:exonuclease SbcD